MKIVVDDKIPYIGEKLEALANEVVALPGGAISAEDVRDADALIVRTRTRCDRQLLEGSRVQLVATATIGFDHLDTEYLQEAGIAWTNCPGCNAASVAQYVACSLLLLQQEKGLRLNDMTLGIVGCGHVGSKVREAAQRLGMRTLICDPPLGAADFVPLDTLEREADILTFHVPLTREGRHATYHMADDSFFHRLERTPYIINTSRGEVVDGKALLSALHDGRVRDAIVDVWEHEPQLDLQLLERVFIGTPHIAGYSADGKVNADNMVVDALCRHFHLPHPGRIVPPELPEDYCYGPDHPQAPHSTELPQSLVLYNPMEDSRRLKAEPQKFEYFRNHYPLRREEYPGKP